MIRSRTSSHVSNRPSWPGPEGRMTGLDPVGSDRVPISEVSWGRLRH
jgi:hypothetical protein